MRFLVSAVLGLSVTVAMLAAALHFYDGRVNQASLRRGIEVTPLPAHHRNDVAEWLRQARGDLPEVGADPVARLAPPPRVEVAPREISGFVQLSFVVQPDGTPTDIRVFGAVPPGVYDEQAVRSVRERRWDPGYDAAGNPVARRANEIVEFTVPAPGAGTVD